MRIIAGQARGRRLTAPDTAGTRPATDRVREAVFSSLGAMIAGSRVADIYAGSGSFGLEALSRGADSVVFVEKGRKALEALKKNIGAVGLGGKVEASEARRWLAGTPGPFNLVFIDPPWDLPTPDLDTDLAVLDGSLEIGAIVVLSRRHTDALPTPPETWESAADRRYGDTRILRYQKVRE